ncbi:MAG: cell envelope biogenesis protein TolA [Beijerinckiaceae bacterium]
MFISEKPGLVVSSTAHVAMLAATILSFSSAPKFDDAQETIPVEMVSTQDFNQIMRGDKKAKTVQPTQKAEKIADVAETKPQPPLAEAKKDVPTPPPPLKRNPDPGDADKPKPPKPLDQVAALPPPRPLAVTPPQPPVAEKPPPEDAEAVEPPKPKEEPKKPDPRLKLDEVAKLLESDKQKDVPKPVERPMAKPKSGEESTDPPRKLNLADISKLLSREAPEQRASTNRTLAQTASLGSPTANASKMSPSLMAQMEGWFQDRFQSCWTTPITDPSGPRYVPMVRVPLNLDGSLSGEPVLVNPPSDPAWRALAESAVRAVRKCNPLPIPERFKPYYEEWRGRVVRFTIEAL